MRTLDPFLELARLGGRAPGVGALVLGARRVKVPGAVVWTFLDHPACAPPVTDRSGRRQAVQSIVLHTVTGQPREIPVATWPLPPSRACMYARYQTATDREVSWDFLVSTAGVILQQNDPLLSYTWQAGGINPRSLGIELEQGPGGALAPEQLTAAVRLCDALTLALGIQRQLPAVRGPRGERVPDRRVLSRFRPEEGSGARWWGILGHRNVTEERGPGDPGDPVMLALLRAGYEGFDLARGEDLSVWAARQRVLRIPETGLPGPGTVAGLRRWGVRSGILVWRPGDPV